MTTTPLRHLSLVLSVAFAVAVSGCGGGSSTMPAGDDTDMTGGDTDMTIQPDPVAFNSVLDRDFTGLVVKHAEDDSFVKAGLDFDADGILQVVYVIDGVEHEVSFARSDYDAAAEHYVKRGSTTFLLWDLTGFFTDDSEFEHFNANGWTVCTHSPEAEDACYPSELGDLRVLRGYVVHGEPTGVLPQGTASYEGRGQWDSFAIDDPSSPTSRIRFRSSMTLTADFDGRTVGGSFHDVESRDPGAQNWEADDGVIEIRSGMIVDTRISADLEEDDPDGRLTGSMAGQFFGPDAAEVGGVIEAVYESDNADDPDAVFQGWFGGTKKQ